MAIDTTELAADLESRVRAELPGAVRTGQLVPFFQPEVDLSSGKLWAAEALVRWDHPSLGMLAPWQFLPLLEELGLMGELTDFMLDAALGEQRRWAAAGLPIPVAVNVPPQCLADPEFPDRVAARLARHCLPGSSLTIEVTEQVAAEPMTAGALAQLDALGVRLAIDDFGAGFSSLGRLGDLLVQVIKLDVSLVHPLVGNPSYRTIVGLAIELAHQLGAKVVAEGVDAPAVEALLISLGCDCGQGYFYARPMPAAEFLAWSRRHGKLIPRRLGRTPPAPSVAAPPPALVDPGGASLPQSMREDSGPRSFVGLAGLVHGWVGRSIGWGPLSFALVALAGYGLWQQFGWGGPQQHAFIDAFAFVPMVAAAAFFSLRNSMRRGLGSATCRAWRLLAVALTLHLLGDLALCVYEAVSHAELYLTLSGVLYLSVFPVALASLLSFPTQRRSRADRLRLLLDMAIVFVACAAVIWYLVLGPAIAEFMAFDREGLATLVFFAGDAALLFGTIALLMRGVPRSSRAALRLIAAGLGLFIGANLAHGYAVTHGGGQTGEPLEALWMAAMTLMFLAASCQLRASLGQEATAPRDYPGFGYSWLPHLAVATCCALLLTVAALQVALYPLGGLLASAILLTALVSLRQLLALRDNRRLAARYQALAAVDGLTGLFNRRHFMELGEAAFASAQRGARPLVALMLDIDHFKEINDARGHAVGDRVLAAVARRCRRQVRASDVIARYGGDELIMLMPDQTTATALQVASRLIAEGDQAAARDGLEVPFGLSIGIAEAAGCTSFDGLLARADHALYEAKRAGRGCARVFEEEAGLEAPTS